MQTRSLSPFTTNDSEENRTHRYLRAEGFVDEELVSSLIERGIYERVLAQSEGMELSSCEDDYAGAVLPKA